VKLTTTGFRFGFLGWRLDSNVSVVAAFV